MVHLELSDIRGRNIKWQKHFIRNCRFFFFFKPKNLPYNPAIQFLGIYPGEMKASINKNTCT